VSGSRSTGLSRTAVSNEWVEADLQALRTAISNERVEADLQAFQELWSGMNVVADLQAFQELRSAMSAWKQTYRPVLQRTLVTWYWLCLETSSHKSSGISFPSMINVWGKTKISSWHYRACDQNSLSIYDPEKMVMDRFINIHHREHVFLKPVCRISVACLKTSGVRPATTRILWNAAVLKFNWM
jgi:hypothetical protein